MKATPEKVSRRSFLKMFGYGAASGVGLAAFGDYSSDWLSVEHSELVLPRWDADGFKVAVLSDFHANSAHEVERSRQAIRLAMEQGADLIAMPGDFINYSSPKYIQNLKDSLQDLHHAKCPVVATMGNHDYWTRSPAKVIAALEEMPLRLLRNESVEVQGVTIAGVEDAIAGRQQFDFLHGKHSKSLLALFHEPDFVVEMPQHVSLQLSGHSHGGQVCLPGGFAVHTPFGAKRFIAGYYPDAHVPLYVTRGIGTVGPNLRLFCRPEVSVLTLRGA